MTQIITVTKATELLQSAANGEIPFDDAFKMIQEIDITEAKKDHETLTVEIPIMFFAGLEDKTLKLASMGGTEVLIDKRAIDEFTKSRLLWKLKMKEIEMNQIKEMINAYEGALERYGHFDDNEKKND